MLSFLFGRYPLTMPHTHHINFTLSQCFVDLKLRYFISTRFCNHRRTSTNYGRLIWDQKDKMLKARGAYQLRLSRGYANHNNCLLPADGSVAVAWTCTIARSKAAAQAARRTSLGRARALTDTQQGRPPVGGTASLRRRSHGDIDTANTGSIKPNCFSSPLRIDP